MADDAARLEELLMLVARTLGAQLIVQERSLSEKAYLLDRLGFDRSEIARICDSTPGTVSVRLSERKKGKKVDSIPKRSDSA